MNQLLSGRDLKDIFGKDVLVDELKRALSERILNTELDEHLDAENAEGKVNHRNGYGMPTTEAGTINADLLALIRT